MDILVNSEIKQLQIIDPSTNLDWIMDFIGNTGALNSNEFGWDAEREIYSCTAEKFVWWERVTKSYESVENRIYALKKIYGSDAVYKAIHGVGGNDFEDTPGALNAALDETFGDEKGEHHEEI